jgi:hypothetical protein
MTATVATRNLIGRTLYAAGNGLHRAGLTLCGIAGWWDAGTDQNGRPTPEDRPYRCNVCGRETIITRGNADPPLPWPDPDGWVCGHRACGSEADA